MQYDLSFLMHHVSVCPFFGRLKFLVFLPYTEPPKKVRFVKNQLLLKLADKYQTTVNYGLLKGATKL